MLQDLVIDWTNNRHLFSLEMLANGHDKTLLGY